MSAIPFVSLGFAAVCATLAWRRRNEFAAKPYFHWFIYLHLAAVGLHQFEEYGWPGGFRDSFVAVFGTPEAQALVPSVTALELANAFGFTILFGVIGWLGTRVVWLGLALLFTNFGNGFFHLVHSGIHMAYVPGAITGTLLYLPLGLLAARYAILRGDVDARSLLLAFGLGTVASFVPFIHVWLLHWIN